MAKIKIDKRHKGVTAAKGFLASGISSGVKRKNRPDLALIFSTLKARCAGLFTANKVKAAPVLLSIDAIKKPMHRGVIINAGSANCLTGKQGLIDAQLVRAKAAQQLGINADELLVCSTGIIGKRLDIQKMVGAIPKLISKLSEDGSNAAAKAIMTTDTFEKEFSTSLRIGGKRVVIGGITKGAGMICPNMATTITVITTDADISKSDLKLLVKDAVNSSFNCVSVDGDMSTNDTLLLFANGASGVKVHKGSKSFIEFSKKLNHVAINLAKMLVVDGEGATKFATVDVINAMTYAQAKRIAFGVANSSLVKTALFGNDPNIGRIASACGASDNGVDADKLKIYISNKMVVKNGVALSVKGLKGLFKKRDIFIRCDLGLGKAGYRAFTSDLSLDYVKINAQYN